MSFNASTTPDEGDSERLLLLRIARILNDARSGESPLGVTGDGGGGSTVADFTQGTKAVSAAGTPVPLVSAQALVNSVTIQARKAPETANTGNVYVGFSGTGGQNLLVLPPGDSITLNAPGGKKIDLHAIYIDAATNADAVQFTAVN